MKRVWITMIAVQLAVSVFAADDVAVTGRQVLAKCRDSVVTVKLVINQGMSYGGRDMKQESKSETTGVVVNESGLTVVSLSAIDPSETINQLMRGQMKNMGGAGAGVEFKCDVTDVKLVLPDETELPAQVVLRDKDLDLAYIRPVNAPPKPLHPVEFETTQGAGVLDEMVVLTRLGQVANRTVAISLARIEAVVEKPRKFYVVGQSAWGEGLGSPVFTKDGKLLGVLLLRNSPADGGWNMSAAFSGGKGLGILPIIVPASDIIEGAKQAAEVKSPTPPAAK